MYTVDIYIEDFAYRVKINKITEPDFFIQLRKPYISKKDMGIKKKKKTLKEMLSSKNGSLK
jgi:predicted RNA-binding protein